MPPSPLVAIVIFQNCPGSKLKPTKNENVVCFATCCARKRFLLSCMVGLIQLPEYTREICFQGYEPCGCQGCQGYKGFYEVHDLKGLMNRRSLHNFKGLRVPKVQRLMGLKG